MDWILITKLIITLTSGLIGQLTAAGAPKEVLDAASAGLAQLEKVHGTLVTKMQVDSVTLGYKW